MQVLEEAASGAGIDYSKWPDVLQVILQRIDYAINHEFPQVKVPQTQGPSAAGPSPHLTANGALSRHATPQPQSPNAATVTTIPVTPQPPNAVEGGEGASAALQASSAADHDAVAASSPSFVPNSQPAADAETGEDQSPSRPTGVGRGTVGDGGSAGAMASNEAGVGVASTSQIERQLPVAMAALYEQIQGALHGPFGTLPPYTYQRLAELVVAPTRHYRTLPAYLRALDRVLSVSSTANVYPLKVDAGLTGAGNMPGAPIDGFMAGSSDPSGRSSTHEGFNGAELTRIPWLRDPVMESEGEGGESDDGEADAPGEMIDAQPSSSAVTGDSAVNTASTAQGYGEGQQTTLVNGLSRTVPADTAAMQDSEGAIGSTGSSAGGGGDEVIHARGPIEIGNEDIGPQRGDGGSMPGIVDLEAAVGRPGEGEVVPGSNVHLPDDRSRNAADDAAEGEGEGEAAAGGEATRAAGQEEKEDEDMTDDEKRDAPPAGDDATGGGNGGSE